MKINPFLNNYWRTIVCDIDDTISVSTTHDWENANPVWDVIDKINKLYDEGWTIILMTARGQVSCNGDFQKADEKYRSKMEAWLKKYGVKYHMLSFEKYLASYYIDDKSLLPESFVDLDIREITNGWSGAKIEKRGDRIYKTNENSLDAAKCYSMASPIVNVPIVYNVIGNTIALEFLNDNGQKFKMDDVIDMIENFSMIETYVPFSNYIERLKDHVKFNIKENNLDLTYLLDYLNDYASIYTKHNTFCHGDFSLENLINTDKGLYLIDPIWGENLWSSYLLDISKLLHSYRKYNRMFEYELFIKKCINKFNVSKKLLQILELSQFVRVLKYINDETIKQDIIKIIFKLHIEIVNNNEILKP